MKKFFVLVLLVLIGCQQTANQKVVIDSDHFIGGTQGLSLSFQELRQDVFDQGTDPFDITVLLENKGESFVNAEDVLVSLSGFNPSDFAKSESYLNKNAPDDLIESRKDVQGVVLPGPQVFVEFPGFNYQKSLSGSTANFIVRANVCYLYKTRAVSKLCVRDNLLNPSAGGICEINEAKSVFNSAAPVQISNVRESIRSRDKVGLSFEVKNVGSGYVFERNSRCDRDDRKKENRVYVIVNSGLNGLSCTGLETTSLGAEGFVSLYGGTKIISCTQEISARSDFEQLVNIEVIYDYEEMTQSSFTVKSIGAE